MNAESSFQKKGLVSDKYIDQTVQRRGKITLAQNRNSRKSVVEIVVVIFLFVLKFCGFVLPELAFLVLDGNFDDSWFVNNASGPLAFFNDANDPSLVAFLLFNVLAIGGGLFTGQADQKTTRRLRRVTLQKLEHVSTGLGHGSHLSDNGQVVDNKGDLVLLITSQSLGVTQKTESGDIGGSMSIVLVHKSGSDAVQAGHGIHAALVSFADVFLADDQLDAVPAFGLVKPLVCIDGNLGTQRLGQDQHIAHHSGIGDDELVRLANSGGHSADGAPGVHDGLASGNGRIGFQSAVLETAHHEGNDDIPLLLGHLGGHGEQHQHVVALGHSHGVQVAENIGAGNFTLHVRVLHEGVEKVRRLHQRKTSVAQRRDR